jgi:hypothetical protein
VRIARCQLRALISPTTAAHDRSCVRVVTTNVDARTQLQKMCVRACVCEREPRRSRSLGLTRTDSIVVEQQQPQWPMTRLTNYGGTAEGKFHGAASVLCLHCF